MTKILETKRLILRTWKASDLESFFEINQDPKVMEFFPGLQDLDYTKNLIDKFEAHLEDFGFTLYAVDRKDTGEFIGFIGLMTVSFDAAFTPAIEIGWRLASSQWGQGFAPEGAKAVLEYAFNELKLPEIVSFTTEKNMKSRRVMEKIGLKRSKNGDFDNPKLSENHPLKPHVLYRLKRADYDGSS